GDGYQDDERGLTGGNPRRPAEQGRDPQARRRRGGPVRQPPVHRRDGDGQERHHPGQHPRPHHRRRAVDRRLLDRRLHPDRRVRHVPHAGPLHLRRDPLGARRVHHRPHHLLGLLPERRPLPRRPPRRAAPPVGAPRPARLHLQDRAGAGVLPLHPGERRDRPPAARPRRLLRPLHRPRRHRPQGHGQGPDRDGDRRRGEPPRGRLRPARDRLRVRRRRPDLRPGRHLQVRSEGDRPEARPARHLHAEADGGDQRLRHALPPELRLPRRRQERLRRRGRRLRPLQDRQALHRRPARPRPRHVRRDRAVGQLLPPPRPRLRGAGLRRLGADQPLGPDPGARHPRRQHRRHPDRAALPGPLLQPVPRLRRDARRRHRRHRERAAAAGAGRGEPLPLHRRGPEAAQRPRPPRHPRRGGRRDGEGPDHPPGPRRPRLRPPRRGPACRVGRVPPPRLPVGARPLPRGLL
ncbi:MAG: Glutamine synthetase type I, partial [uncultured Thermomicrobiales bacterium]